MPRMSVQQAVDKWQRKSQGASQDYVNGINAVTQAPGAAAARNVQGYVNGVQAAVTSGKWQQNVGAVSLEDWRRAAVEKGAARLGPGVMAAAPKMAAALDRVFPMIDRAQQEISGMDRSTPEARIARSSAFQLAMYRQASQNRGGRR